MKFGHFDDKNREYVIETPHTPLPWINYLGVGDFHSLISNTLGGYSFYKDAKLRRLTRYRYNNVPRDISGRFFYIKDKDAVYNIGYLPCKTELDFYECRHGLSYSIFTAKKNGLKSTLTAFVPLEDACEINKIEFENESDEEKSITLYGVVEFCLYNAVDDANNYQRNLNLAQVEVTDSTIFHKTEYRERRNHYCFYHCSEKHIGFDTDRNIFLGLESGFDSPIAVMQGKSFNSIVSDCYPIASHEIHILLKSKEKKTVTFLLGYVENDVEHKFNADGSINKEKANALINKYDDVRNVESEFEKLKLFWNNLLQHFQIKSGDEKFDRMANIWNQYQCMVTYMMSRSASYFETGTGRGMGFRDSCQDLLGFVHMIPEKARERIIDIASIQFKDGSTYHQYQPLTKRGNADIGSGFNDDPLWLVGAVCEYIKETGDTSILSERVPFNNEKGSEQSLYDHLMISLNYTIQNLGPHGLPLIGRADWNDCLNLNCFSYVDGESFQTVENNDTHTAESVFIAGMFVKYGKEFVELAKRINKKEDADYILNNINKIESNTIKYGFDYEGGYFIRAYDAYSKEIGSSKCKEGKIFIEPQGFCTMAHIGEKEGLGKKACQNSLKYLLDDYGCEILYPPYSRYYPEYGEISSYPEGTKENGAVFNHNNPWLILALCEEGMKEAAFDLYKRNAPSYIEDKSDIHQTEPYVYSQMIAGRFNSHYGRAKNSWLTGTASWSFVALSEGLLGIRPEYDGLFIKPELPKEMKKVIIDRIYRNKKFHIIITNNTSKNEVLLNGAVIKDGLLPINQCLDENEVIVNL